jgi:hypothetical protein
MQIFGPPPTVAVQVAIDQVRKMPISATMMTTAAVPYLTSMMKPS